MSKRSASRCSETSQTLTEEPEVVFHLIFFLTEDLRLHFQVKWFEQQRELRRVKRDVPIEQHVKKRDFGDGPDPVVHSFMFGTTVI